MLKKYVEMDVRMGTWVWGICYLCDMFGVLCVGVCGGVDVCVPKVIYLCDSFYVQMILV